MTWKIKRPRHSVLGLTLDDGQLRAVRLSRSQGTIGVVDAVSAVLSLDLLHPEPELIGREVRNHLDAAGIRERTCVVSVPGNWIMSQHTKIPALSPEDADSFLRLETEKGFPYDPAQLQIARSFHRSAEAAYVTQFAVRRDRLDHLAAVAKAAGLKPMSFALGLAALPDVAPPPGEGRITVALEPKEATLLVSAGGGIAAFRTSEAAIESEAGEALVNMGAVARELRITFEQVPADLRRDLRRLSLRGVGTMVGQLAESLGEWPAAAGLTIERGAGADDALARQIAEAIGRRWLVSADSEIEFLPPRPGRWASLATRYSSKRFGTAGLAAGGAALAALAAFGAQEIWLGVLRSQWDAMQAQVADLTAIQDRIRDFRPWHDGSFPDLRVLARVTRCFPDNGSVTARTFDIRHVAAVTTVSISGVARDDRALLRTQDQLRKAKEIQGLKVEAISGKVPAQFTFTFRWMGDSEP